MRKQKKYSIRRKHYVQMSWGGRIPGAFKQLEEDLFDRSMKNGRREGERYWKWRLEEVKLCRILEVSLRILVFCL